MIELKNIFAGYHNKDVLKDISLTIKESSFSGIIGPNGAGKSTLLKCLCGVLKFHRGQIIINGKNITDLKKSELSKAVSYMPQTIESNLSFSVYDFVMLGRFPHLGFLKNPSKNDKKIVREVMEFTNIADFSQRKTDELSGGERQRVLIAQTIAQGTPVIVFDEPTAHLDIGAQNDILKLLKTLNRDFKKTIIATMHDLNAAGEFCDNLILLNLGQIKSCGLPEDVLNYKDIEEVYKTTVIVKTNPISNKPYVIPTTTK
ncbi:MAG: ABC transporter ATP-binding protein [Endomicrobia bacterium]|nr:ABC transporter ATP-binding protein [Endomicrobiia bacterium]